MTDLITVRILGIPLDIMQRSAEHSDELLREFALIREEGTDHVPARLLRVIEELRGRFGAFAAGPRQAMQEALERGDHSVDLEYVVPPEVGGAAERLRALLDEADQFCRAGDLLTLATPPDGLAFRQWYLEEFERQIAGRPPRPWVAIMNDAATG